MSSAGRWDAIVIGAGVNGLVAAHSLARAGRRVLVVERAPATDPALETGWVPPGIVRELELERHGFRVHQPDPWITAPLDGGGRLDLWSDTARSAEAIRRLSPGDAAKWPEFCARMRNLAAVLERLYTAPPPDIETRDPRELVRLAGLAVYVRRLGKQTIIDLARVLPMSIAELLDDWFESDVLKGTLGALGVWHLKQGPRSGGTAFNFLHHHVGSPANVFRPPRTNVRQALRNRPGVEVRWGEAASLRLSPGGRVRGVALAPSGDELESALVVSSADPRATFAHLAPELDVDVVRALGNIKARAVVAQGSVTWQGPVGFARLCIAPSLEYLERAYDAAKYGRDSEHPYVELEAEEGRIALHVQYVPLLNGGWTDARQQTMQQAVTTVAAPYAPEIKTAAGRVQLALPNHLYHGELTLDQILFMRPVPGWSRYRTPVEGVYWCGAGTHPGGGIAGAAGRNAAGVILRETKPS